MFLLFKREKSHTTWHWNGKLIGIAFSQNSYCSIVTFKSFFFFYNKLLLNCDVKVHSLVKPQIQKEQCQTHSVFSGLHRAYSLSLTHNLHGQNFSNGWRVSGLKPSTRIRINTSKPEAVSDRHSTCLLSQWRMEHESKDVDLLVILISKHIYGQEL